MNNNQDNNTPQPDEDLQWVERELIRLLAAAYAEQGDTDTCPKCGQSKGNNPKPSAVDGETLVCAACAETEIAADKYGIQVERDNHARFRTRIVITRQAQDEFPEDFIKSCLDRHAHQDWGDLDLEDKRANDRAVKSGGRVLSSYELRGDSLWIITEADRTLTTILCPEEY